MRYSKRPWNRQARQKKAISKVGKGQGNGFRTAVSVQLVFIPLPLILCLPVVSAITQQVVGFLSDAASYPHHPREVTLLQTHASWVFIASPFVYKVKKPVNLGFLDFSTLELRRADCEREIELNRRLAEDVYLGLERICERNGRLHFGEEGTVVEWAVKMRELDSRFILKRLLHEESVTAADIDRLVDTLERFYKAQPPLPRKVSISAIEHLRHDVEDNFKVALQFVGRSLSQLTLNAISRYAHEFLARHGRVFDARAADGWVRDCHGDLHLDHIHLSPEAVRIYDCLEFNSDLRHIDIACDLAFLAMDLDFNGRPDLARRIVERFARDLRDDGMRSVMDFYKCYRACVRGKVESLHATAETVEAGETFESFDLAQRYFQLALRYAVTGSVPRAFVFMGGVGTGKSALAEAFGRETVWSVLSSDRLRKTLAGIPETHRGNEDERAALYSAEMTRRTYDRLFESTLASLHHGNSIILDATFSNRAVRDQLKRVLESAGYQAPLWIEACASEPVVLDRLRARAHLDSIVSDARSEDLETLNARYEPPSELRPSEKLTLTTEAKPEQVVGALMTELAVRQACRMPHEPTESRAN
jgi:uncharacterized protein